MLTQNAYSLINIKKQLIILYQVASYYHSLNINLSMTVWVNLHWNICIFYGWETAKNCDRLHPVSVRVIGNVTISWYFTKHANKTIKSNLPEIVIRDHKNSMCSPIYVRVPEDCNILF